MYASVLKHIYRIFLELKKLMIILKKRRFHDDLKCTHFYFLHSSRNSTGYLDGWKHFKSGAFLDNCFKSYVWKTPVFLCSNTVIIFNYFHICFMSQVSKSLCVNTYGHIVSGQIVNLKTIFRLSNWVFVLGRILVCAFKRLNSENCTIELLMY